MGGRGSASRSSRASQVVSFLRERSRNAGNSPRSRNTANMAAAAADLIESGRASELMNDRRTGVLAREMPSVSQSTLQNALDGRNVPIGMERFDWARMGLLVAELNHDGYTNDEIAASIRLDRYIKEALR